jgi:hypothetical protein
MSLTNGRMTQKEIEKAATTFIVAGSETSKRITLPDLLACADRCCSGDVDLRCHLPAALESGYPQRVDLCSQSRL